MRAERSEQLDRAPRRQAPWLGWVVLTMSVLVGAAFALRRRQPALPALPAAVEQRRPPSAAGRRGAPVPAPPRLEHGPGRGAVFEPAVEPVFEPVFEPTVEPVSEPVSEPDVPPVARPVMGVGREQLVRVSGLGRRSAEALVLAGIASLEALAASDGQALGDALDAAGVQRSATLATWPRQARRLLEA